MEVITSAFKCKCGKIFKTLGGYKSHKTQSVYCNYIKNKN